LEMVITDTPRSLAMSFIRVLMIVIQYIEPSGRIPVYDDFSEGANGLSRNCGGSLVSQEFLWHSAISLLTSITLPIIVLFRVTSPVLVPRGNC
jgi:hypothetical protein